MFSVVKAVRADILMDCEDMVRYNLLESLRDT